MPLKALFASLLAVSSSMAAEEALPPNLETWMTAWDETGVTPSRVEEIPLPLFMGLEDGTRVKPGDVVTTEQLMSAPVANLTWNCDPSKLYALFVSDNEGMADGNEYLNYLVYNIKRCDVAKGYTAVDYLAPFTLELDPAVVGDKALLENSNKTLTFLYLVYEQPDPKPMEMGSAVNQRGCNSDMAGANSPRSKTSPSKLAVEHGLRGPVAGTVLAVRANTAASSDQACRMSLCTGRPFPAEIPGVNDHDRCLPAALRSGATPGTASASAALSIVTALAVARL